MSQQSLGERRWVLPVHEMPTGDLLDDVLVLEHPGGKPVIRRRGNRIVKSGKDDGRHGDGRGLNHRGRSVSVVGDFSSSGFWPG